MDKTKQPQQLSFCFEESTAQNKIVPLAPASVVVAAQDIAPSVKTIPAVVYDFQSAAIKRKDSAHASLYRQILDSVRHIG